MAKTKCIYNGVHPDNGECKFHNTGICNNSNYCPNQKLTNTQKIINFFKQLNK